MSIAVTTKGYSVAGVQHAYNPKLNHWLEYSGRVRVLEGDPYYDLIVRWDDQGNAINHDLGDLVLDSGTNYYKVKQGENIFRDLKG